MELKCVVVLALVPLVTASPHGYGGKGGVGAAAKAEAAAGAGAFTGVPLAIPRGAGYSGSFAKSSSSSFAASSASSSASSFSFSGSGTIGAGANSFSGAGGNDVGTDGCTGNCKINNIIPDSPGAGSSKQGYNSAKAVAGAGAVAFSGAPYGKDGYQISCSSGDCSNPKPSDCGDSNCADIMGINDKCTSGKCEPTSQATETSEKCTSIQCIPSSKIVPSYDADDIQVNIASIGPTTKSLNKPNSDDQINKYFNMPSDKEPSQLAPPTHDKPTRYLSTPKEDTPCTSPDCASNSLPHGGVYDNGKPSSYNVPILGPDYISSTANTERCSNSNCKKDQSGSPQTNLSSGFSGSGSICASGSCQNYPTSQINPGSFSPSGAPTVVPSSSVKNPSYTPSNFDFINTAAAASSNAIKTAGVPKSTMSTDKNPSPYTGGFGGPAGILKPNEFRASNQIHTSSAKPALPAAASSPTKPVANIPTCSNGNCKGPKFPAFNSGYPVVQTPSQPSVCAYGSCGVSPGSTAIQQSSSVSYNAPPSTGNFGGPSGILKPNDYSKPDSNPTPIRGSYNPPSFPSIKHDQTNEPGTVQYNPVGSPLCSYGNCQGQVSSSGVYSPSGPSKPNTQIPLVGFGGPAGFLRPNDFTKPLTPSIRPTPAATINYNPLEPSSSQHNQLNKPNTSQYQPAGPSGSKPCPSGNCGYEPPQLQFGSAPTAQRYPTLCQSGKCQPEPTQTSKVPAGAYNPAYCTSGNCGINPFLSITSTPKNPSLPGLNQPKISGSYHSAFPSSTSSSNYGPNHAPNQDQSSLVISMSDSINPSCTSGKCRHDQPSPQYNSGDKPASSANTYNPQSCPVGKCGIPNQVPNIPSTTAKAFSPATCFSGNCGVNSVPGHSKPPFNQLSSKNIAVGAVASAGAIAYTGGFGGPPGLLKPYDGGKLSSLPAGFGPKGPYGASSHGPAVQPSYGKSLSGAGAQASAVAGTAAGAYGGNSNLGGYNGQGRGKGGCSSGCESQVGADFGQNGGLDGFGALSAARASAKSAAGAFGDGGAGVYGQAGSFASSSATAHAIAGSATKGSGYGR